MTLHTVSTLTDGQEIAMSLLTIPSACLSIFGSTAIIVMAYKAKRDKKWTPYTRLLIGMSCCDVIFSIALILSGFLMPRETSQRVWAIGNDASCSFLGFLLQFSYSAVLYNCMLSLYFLLTARFRVKNQVIAKRIEPLMHILAIGFPLGTAIAGASLSVYNELELGQGCWVVNYPENCGVGAGRTGEPCKSPLVAWIFGGSVTFVTLICLIVNNLIILAFLTRQTRPHRTIRRRRGGQNSSNCTNKKSSSSINRQNSVLEDIRSVTEATTRSQGNTSTIIYASRELASVSSGRSSQKKMTMNYTNNNNSTEKYAPSCYTQEDDGEKSSSSSSKNNNYPQDANSREVPTGAPAVAAQEQEDESNNNKNKNRHERQQLKRLRLVASQAFLYVGAFIICTIWTIILRVWESQTDSSAPSLEDDVYPLLVLQSFFLPLQGFFNMLIYTRPKFIKCRLEFPGESRIWTFRRALLGTDVIPSRDRKKSKEQDKRERATCDAEMQVVTASKKALAKTNRTKEYGASGNPMMNQIVRVDQCGAIARLPRDMISSITASRVDDDDDAPPDHRRAWDGSEWEGKSYDMPIADSKQVAAATAMSCKLPRSTLSSMTASVGDFPEDEEPNILIGNKWGEGRHGGGIADQQFGVIASSKRRPSHTMSSIASSLGDFQEDELSDWNGNKWEEKPEGVAPLSSPPLRMMPKRLTSSARSLDSISESETASFVENAHSRITRSKSNQLLINGVTEQDNNIECDMTVRSSESHKKRVRFQEGPSGSDRRQLRRWNSSSEASRNSPLTKPTANNPWFVDKSSNSTSEHTTQHQPEERIPPPPPPPPFDRMQAVSPRRVVDSPMQAPKRRMSPPTI